MYGIDKYQQIDFGDMGARSYVDGARKFAGVSQHCMGIIIITEWLFGNVGGVRRRTNWQPTNTVVQRRAVAVAWHQISRPSDMQK